MDFQNTIFNSFAQAVSKNPNRIAIQCSEKSITYKDLAQKINQFAAYLSNLYEIPPKYIVIALPPSIEFIIIMFACIKLKYAYIPIDLSLPDKYIKNILTDSKADALITNNKYTNRISDLYNITIINIHNVNLAKFNTDFARINIENKTVYVIYTSGSTGEPKGVLVTYDGLANLINRTTSIYYLNNNDCVPLFHSLSFDVSVWEICSTLLNGGKLIIPPDHIKKSPLEFFDFIVTNQITIANFTPSYFYIIYHSFLNASPQMSQILKLRLILLAGEPFHPKKIMKWFDLQESKKISIFNMYGITEGTIHSTYIKITKKMTQLNSSLLGTPLPGVNLMLVNTSGKAINKHHEEGEIYLNGVSLSSGYLNQQELTNQKFIHTHFGDSKNERWLKTGDFATYGSHGLEFIGRKDKLAKIRGFRIHLSDIENILCNFPKIEGAVVCTYLASEDQTRLVAFIKANKNLINIDNIITDLKKELPEYMIPSKIFSVDQFPLTKNGKIDTNLLIETYLSNPLVNITEKNITHHDELYKTKLAWQSVLNTEQIDENANFFDVGGDSLLLAQLQYKLNIAFDREFKMLDLMKHSTIQKFVNFVSNNTH